MRGALTLVAALVSAAGASARVEVDDIQIHWYNSFQNGLLRMNSQTFGVFGAVVTQHSAGNATFSGLGIAELYQIYDAVPGELVDGDFVARTPPILGNTGGDPNDFEVRLQPGQSRYFAFWDSFPYLEDPGEVFGWFKLVNDGQSLVVASSATSRRHGIQVGSITAVPEPSSVGLGALGALAAAAAGRRARRASTKSLPSPT